VYIQGNTVEDQNSSHLNVTGSSMTGTLSMLSPNSIPSPPACHYAVMPPGNLQRGFKMCYFK